MQLPSEIIHIIIEFLADSRPFSATSKANRAEFLATDGPFWAARGVNRARLATAKTAQFITPMRAIAAGNLAVFEQIRPEISPLDIVITAIKSDSSKIFAVYFPLVDEKSEILCEVIRDAAYNCVQVI